MYRHKKNTPSLKKADHSPLMDILSKLSDTFQNNGDLNELQVLVDELISQVFVPVHMKLEKLLDLFKNIRDLLKNRELETVLRLKLNHWSFPQNGFLECAVNNGLKGTPKCGYD